MSSYPEHEKLHKIKNESQAQGEFVEWLQSKGVNLMIWDHDDNHWYHDHRPIQSWLAEYHEIDLKVLKDEKRAMLAQLRGEKSD